MNIAKTLAVCGSVIVLSGCDVQTSRCARLDRCCASLPTPMQAECFEVESFESPSCAEATLEGYIGLGYCEFSLGSAGEPFPVTARTRGDRTTIPSLACDPTDGARCLLPFPSNLSTTADPTTLTSRRMQLDMSSINSSDDPAIINRHDGFSVVSRLIVSVPFEPDMSSAGGPLGGALRLFESSPGSASDGEEIPIRIEARNEGGTWAIMGYPLRPLRFATDYIYVLTGAFRSAAGIAYVANHEVRASVGLELPLTERAQLMANYHRSNMVFLEAQGVRPADVLRLGEFTTRSETDATSALPHMIEQATANTETAVINITSVSHLTEGSVATVLLGEVRDVPVFRTEAGDLAYDANNLPIEQRRTTVPFRITIPRGEGTYRVLLFGHGAAGSYLDTNFDELFANAGYAKISLPVYGWNRDEVFAMANGLSYTLRGAQRAVSPLMDTVAHMSIMVRLATSRVPELLTSAAFTVLSPEGGVLTEPNPHSQRQASVASSVYVGGSLGGVVGLVLAAVDPALDFSVVNTGGGAWTHWATDSVLYSLVRATLELQNSGRINSAIGVGFSQILFDQVDVVNYSEMFRREGDNQLLLQEAIGDAFITNDGSRAAAIACGAVHVGEIIEPYFGSESAVEVRDGSGYTQFETGLSAVPAHGFAVADVPSGDAAIEQILSYLDSIWEGSPVMSVPSTCLNGCRFSPVP